MAKAKKTLEEAIKAAKQNREALKKRALEIKKEADREAE